MIQKNQLILLKNAQLSVRLLLGLTYKALKTSNKMRKIKMLLNLVCILSG